MCAPTNCWTQKHYFFHHIQYPMYIIKLEAYVCNQHEIFWKRNYVVFPSVGGYAHVCVADGNYQIRSTTFFEIKTILCSPLEEVVTPMCVCGPSGRWEGTDAIRQRLTPFTINHIRQLLSGTHHMSPTRAWKWKWSNGVEKSEIDLFWCISMTNNVKSCQKINGRVQTFRFSVFSMGRQELCAENA